MAYAAARFRFSCCPVANARAQRRVRAARACGAPSDGCSTSGRAGELRAGGATPPAAPVTPALATALACSSLLLSPEAALAFQANPEPGNALSLQTWAIHVSSVVEWATAMGLFWRYAEVTNNSRFKGMAWAMVPCLGSAMAACTWHFFYNSPQLEWLVVVQAGLTVAGNCTCWLAAYRLYEAAMAEKSAS